MKARLGNVKAPLALLALWVMIVFAGGCGGSNGSSDGTTPDTREKLYVLGEMHGDLSDEMEEAIHCAAFTGSERDAPLLISYEDGFDIDIDTAAAIRELLEAGHATGLEHATEEEVNKLLKAIGFEGGFVMPAGHTYVEFYGIKMSADGDIFTYVTLNDDENLPVELLTSPDSLMIGEGVFVSNDGSYERPVEFTLEDLALMAEYGLTLSGDEIMSGDRILTSADVISGDMVLSADGTWVPDDFDIQDPPSLPIGSDDLAEAELALTDSIVEWLYSSDVLTEEARKSKDELGRELAARGANDLTKIASMFQRTFDASTGNQRFKITVEVYSCHTFNTADGTENDWFFVKQYSQLDPKGAYIRYPKNTIFHSARGYIVYYSFDNYLIDSQGKYVNTGVKLQQAKPEATHGSDGITSSVAFNFEESVGITPSGTNNAVYNGASYSSKESHVVQDCYVNQASRLNFDLPLEYMANWIYSFTRPKCKGATMGGFNTVEDAPMASRSLFEPVHQWAWRIDDAQRENVKGFKINFRWQSGITYPEYFILWIKRQESEHKYLQAQETEYYVPFEAIYPPIIAGNRLDFPKTASVKKLTMAVCRNWTASSDQSWCRLDRTSGDKDDSDDVHVTVDENTTGEDREAYITLKTTDGKGTFKVTVFQAKD